MIKKESSFYLDCMRSIWVNDTDLDAYLKNNPLVELELPGNYVTNFEFKNATINKLIHFSFNNSYINPSFRYIEPKEVFIQKLKDSTIILNCNFKDDVILNIQNPKTKISFIECVFEKRLIILFNTLETENNHQLVFGKCKINDFLIEGTCDNIFSIYHTKINSLEIKNTRFKEIFEFIDVSVFGKLEIDSSYFKKTTLIDNCKFYEFPELKYNIFESFTHFRNTEFKHGLILDYCSFEKDVNFYNIKSLDSEISKQFTSQETYRIIKNQFEKLNNKIEANKYHALELDQRKRELEKNKWQDFSEYLVFQIHNLSSKHSTSWFRAVLWIIFIGFFTMFLIHFNILKDLFFHPSNFKIEYLPKIVNEFWQYINITNLEKLKDKPFIFFLNKVSLGYLYYQFLTAVRKDTRK